MARFISIVREALVRSVTCTAPFVSFQISQVSIVPNNASPSLAMARASGACSRIHWILVAEKYASGTRPVFAVIRGDRAKPAGVRSPAALPDDRGRERSPRFPIPHHGCFPLVGDAYGHWRKCPTRPVPSLPSESAHSKSHPRPVRPIRGRVHRREGQRPHQKPLTGLVVENGAGASGSFIEGQDVGHACIMSNGFVLPEVANYNEVTDCMFFRNQKKVKASFSDHSAKLREAKFTSRAEGSRARVSKLGCAADGGR